ncbi:MAG: 3'-5' exonuclease [Blastocatellia bacterium]
MIPLASTFVDSLENLNNNDSGLILKFLNKFHQNPALPSLSLERLSKIHSSNIWSARVNNDLRAILCQESGVWIAIYVDHHDPAYRWAENHQVGKHPITGEWQIVPVPVVTGKEKPGPRAKAAKGIFDRHSNDYLLSLGVPEIWLPLLREVKTEEKLHELLDQMPVDVAIRLLDLSQGRTVLPPVPLSETSTLAELEAGTSQLVVVQSERQLQSILKEPMAKWMAFLHPTQKKLVNYESKGATKVTGSAGTGKTVVAMHRARHLASEGRRVLVTSFTQTICKNIERNLRLICSKEEMWNISVIHVHKLAAAVLRENKDRWIPRTDDQVGEIIRTIHPGAGCPLDAAQMLVEYLTIVVPQEINSWDQYRGASRAGRGRPLTVKERKEVWPVLGRLIETMNRKRLCTWQGLSLQAAQHLPPVTAKRAKWRYDAVIVDEVQDLKPLDLHFLARLAPVKNLLVAGDAGQQIYPGRVSLNSVGIDVRGRSTVLKINYRTTEQIREFADRLLPADFDDLDEGLENRGQTRSVLRGIDPILHGFDSAKHQYEFVVGEIKNLITDNRYREDEIAIFARQANSFQEIIKHLRKSKIPYFELSKEGDPAEPAVNLGTMHRAKGLEFKVVFVIDLHDGNVPHLKTVNASADEIAKAERMASERQLLYVGITRARDLAYLTWAETPSQFLQPHL